MKRSFNFIKKELVCNKIFKMGLTFIFVGIVLSIPIIFAELQPVKSVEILSEESNYNEKEAGSWKIDKSASFKTIDTCLVTIDLETISKSSDRGQDIVFIIDTSESMTGEKLNMMKLGVINAINEVLVNDKNRVGLTFFNSVSSIESNLSNDKELLINKVNSLTVSEGTNYYQALVGLDNFLGAYENDDRDFKVVFITDGLPNMNHPNEVGEYNYLKDKYPYLRVEAVQYEISEDVLDEIENISDKQYVSNRDNFSEIIKSIVKGSNKFEEFRVVDFINSEMFNIEDITDIKVDRGSVSLDNNTISWNLDDVMSFNKARMTYKLKLNKTSERIYPVGEKIEVNSKLGEMVEEVNSPKTPVLSNSYKVIYDGNEPEGCRVEGIPEDKEHLIFDLVGISEVEPVCEGYQFKGWDITTSGVSKINDDYYIMPEDDVILKAKWSKLDIKKSINGKIHEVQTIYKMMSENSFLDNEKSTYVNSSTGIDFSKASSDTNGKGVYKLSESKDEKFPILYYRGEVDNNVIFANYCWKIVRTTDTGGVKLLYNGVPSSDGKCNNSGDESHLSFGKFNENKESLTDIGYMYGDRDKYTFTYIRLPQWNSFVGKKLMSYSNDGTVDSFYYSDSVEWNSNTKEYTLKNNDGSEVLNKEFSTTNCQELQEKYICLDGQKKCSKVAFLQKYCNNSMEYFEMNNGETYLSLLEEASKEKWIYGNDAEWDGNKYILKDTFQSSPVKWNDEIFLVGTRFHYTCFSTENSCKDVGYIYFFDKGTVIYHLILTGGEKLEGAVSELSKNLNDSAIKKNIDSWFNANLLKYSDKIEDTVWCNDRDIDRGPLKSKDDDSSILSGVNKSIFSYFRADGRNVREKRPSLKCSNNNDKFTVNNDIGNGALTYPIALLTTDELILAGSVVDKETTSYLNSGQFYWTMSPRYFSHIYADEFVVRPDGSLNNYYANVLDVVGVRPSISLLPNTIIASGSGTTDNPYFVE